MRSRDFCYWLQGFFEIHNEGLKENAALTPMQIEKIRNHLNMVFKHEIDPTFGEEETQKALQALGHPTRHGEIKLNC